MIENDGLTEENEKSWEYLLEGNNWYRDEIEDPERNPMIEENEELTEKNGDS